MASVSGSQPVLGDILSMALKNTGVQPAQSTQQLSHGELDQAAGAIDDSLFPSDLNSFTEGLFSDFTSTKATSSLPNETSSFPVSSTHAVNGSRGQVYTPSCNSTPVSEPLSMPVFVNPQATTEQYRLPTYRQNSVQEYSYSSSQAAASASTPLGNTSGSFSGVSANTQQADTGFGSQGGTPTHTANLNQSPYDQDYSTSRVLHDDKIDLDGLDEFLAAEPPMDIPSPTSQFQSHGQQLPQAYSTTVTGYVAPGSATNVHGVYSQSSPGGVLVPSQSINSVSPAVGQFNINGHQYGGGGIQPQSLMSPSYPTPQGSLMLPQQSHAQIPQPSAQAFSQPRVQQMGATSSMNGSHFVPANQPMSTDLSNILPSTSLLHSLPPSNGGGGSDIMSLTETDIHDILDLGDLDFDPNQFGLEPNMSTDPFASFGMSSVNLIQPSNTVRFNGSTTAALVSSSSAGSAVNAPSQMRLQQQQQANGRPTGPAYGPVQQSSPYRSKFNIHSPVFGRGRQSPLSGISSRGRTPGAGRGAGIPMPSQPQPVVPEADDESDEEEEFGAADTYANYKPAKLSIGKDHPDPVVESSSLSSVEPPRVWFDLKLPSPVIDEIRLSSLQLEAIVYACQQHKNILTDGSRAGFLVGDGAGVGKGRTIAGIIYQNYLEGRKKALWLSVSNDLKYDAVRDLRDLGATNIKVYSLNKFRYGKISGKRNGRVRKGVIFATYSSLIGESSSGGKYRTRLNQLLHWLGSQFEGVIVFDECHKAKNLVPSGSGKPSKTGLTVLQLQKKLPKARIVYCSATGASEPKNMAYMSRLGIWGMGTQFPSFTEFIKAVERRGVGAMELVAMDMKLRGMYMARQLSFTGVSFSITEVQLSERFIEAYDASVELWNKCHEMFKEASEVMGYDKQQLKTMWGQFWASHQRFFKYMCIAAKVPEVIKLAKKALEDGKCVVIGLQSTGEARTLEQLERNSGELTGFISTAKGVLETLIRRHFPAPVSALASIDWSLLDNDPTLPRSCRKRKRAAPRPRMTAFQEDKNGIMSDSDDSSTPGGSDSAVESSSDDGDDKGETSDDSDSESSSDDKSSGVDSEKEDFNPFGSTMNEPWLQPKPKKSKKRKSSPSNGTPPKKKKRKQKNYSIKPPPTSSKRGKTKTGFNSKSLKFEPVQSPSEFLNKRLLQPSVLDRRQSIAVVDGLTNNRSSPSSHTPNSSVTPPPPHLLERKGSLQVTGVGEGQSLVDAMSARSSPGLGDRAMLTNRDATVRAMKDELMKKLDVLAPHLPTNTLDELVDGLGGPDKVAEMTGRRGRVVSLPDGSVQYQLRSETDVSMEILNIAEKERFMGGEKDVAIISEAASSGISLQADRRVKNLKRRVHITLELPWSADRAIQQFGRTHRSNQVSAPEYVFLISTLSGEQRFASIVAKRLESLGALTHGDRRATESRDLSKYNLDTKFGHQALEITLKSIAGVSQPSVKSEEYTEEFFKRCQTALVGAGLVSLQGMSNSLTVEKDALNMSRFLNRILGLPVNLQNQLFSYFTDTLAAVCQQAKKLGKFDSGIQDFGAQGEHVEVVEMREYVGDPAFGTATTQLVKVRRERGMSFKEAVQKLNTDHLPGDGFCISNKVYSNDKHTAILIKAVNSSGKFYQVYRPNTGVGKQEKLSSLMKKYTRAGNEGEAEKWWNEQYENSISTCQHAYTQGKCRNVGTCEVGLRHTIHHVLSGSVLGVWTHIEGVFQRHSTHNPRMQIVRVRTNERRLSGILIPGSFVEDMTQTLARIDQQASGTGTSDDPIQL